jgi:thioredoxin
MHLVQEIDAAQLSTEIAGPTPMLVDFWAPWCGPCRMVAPALEELAGELEGRMRIAKLNVDDEPAVANHYGVQGIPTLILFAGGREIDRVVGAPSRAALREWLLAAAAA